MIVVGDRCYEYEYGTGICDALTEEMVHDPPAAGVSTTMYRYQ